jgi:alpha-methylacyl-CoA racemase
MSGAPPLVGLKVLDLSRHLPGPYATLLLADLGAQVDKVEDPNGGDPTRQVPPFVGGISAAFAGLNRNKRSIAIDLRRSEGAVTLKALCQHYDVLVESFRPGVMERLEVGHQTLLGLNPRLVSCAISGYGATGPDRLRAGHDLDFVARAGVLGAGGDAETPAMPGGQVADIGGGLFAVAGILAALHERARTGRGRFVDVSMTDGALGFTHLGLSQRLLAGRDAPPPGRGRGPLHGALPCYGLYPTQDGRWMALGALEPKFFLGLCEALGRPDLTEGAYDPGESGRKTREALEAVFAQRTQREWTEFFRPLDVCVEPVLEGDDVVADEQLNARGLFEAHGGTTWLRTPLAMGRAPISPPPSLGEHTRAILHECGLE